MSKKKRNNRSENIVSLDLLPSSGEETSAVVTSELNKVAKSNRVAYLKKHWWMVAVICFLALGSFGAVMKSLQESAERQRLNQSSGEQNSSFLSRLNPFASAPAPVVTTTPQLSKEYIYAGSRLLAVEDANASASPPADLAIWRPSNGEWWVMGSSGSQQTAVAWGATGDQPAQGDYDGDGKTDFAVFRKSNGVWYFVNSSTGDSTQSYDYFPINSDDKVAPADFDGDGKTDAATFRLTTGNWSIRYSSNNQLVFGQFGQSGDIPTPADFDGDGKADMAVFRGGSNAFYVYRSSDLTVQTISYGQAGDRPVVADYDGDGRADAAVRRGGYWHILQSTNNTTASLQWGNTSNSAEAHNDYDGDGKVDLAYFIDASGDPNAGKWYIRNSSTGSTRVEQWGLAGDIPVPALFRR